MGVSQLGAQSTSGYQFFSSSGTFTPSFTGTVYVSLIGGGDGAYNGTIAGQSGKARFKVPVAVTQGVPLTVTLGNGGASGSNPGSATTFDVVSSATGLNSSAGGAGGSGMPGKVAPFSPYGDGGSPGGGGNSGAVLVEW